MSPYCFIEVRRENLIEDALNILSKVGMNFKKEIKVKFINEEGIDSGGVRKEFFQAWEESVLPLSNVSQLLQFTFV